MLEKYRSKRNFSVTPEPKGGAKTAEHIFVVQFHEARRDHYDFRLSHGGVLLSWAVPHMPSLDPKVKRLAVMVEAHPTEYADFEGEIPLSSYGGGMVTIFDKGTYEQKVDFDSGLKSGSLKFTLFGKKLRGGFALVRMDGKNWLLIKERDDFAQADDAKADVSDPGKGGKAEEPGKAKKSVNMGAENTDKTRPIPIKDILGSVKLAKPSADIPSGKEWLFEVKYDGFRIIASSSPVALLSRNGKDLGARFASIARAIGALCKGHKVVFDGEVAAIKDGRIDFSALGDGEPIYFIFDLLYCDGDLRSLPLEKRKNKLRHLLKNAAPPLTYVKSYLGGEELFAAVKEMELEGIVCKRKDASYFEGDWLKIKRRMRQEFVVCGYLGEQKVRSLILGAHIDGRLCYVGKVGSGISADIGKRLKETLAPLLCDKPTVACKTKDVHWVKPTLMAEVEYAELTSDAKLRQPAFKGLRSDKDASTVTLETIEKSSLKKSSETPIETPHKKSIKTSPDTHIEKSLDTIEPSSEIPPKTKLTHPDRVVFSDPVVTKADVFAYYEKAAERILPYLKGRPISVLRCNDGIDKPFFVKHPHGKKDELIFIDTAEELLNEVQNGTVEFHVTSAAGTTFFMTFDLDPDPALDLKAVRKCALDVRATLSELGLRAFLKLSGGKGYHIVSPMPPFNAEQFASLSRSVAEAICLKSEIYTLNIKKDKRKGKIFIDWQRNSPSATFVAPYSLRARKGAPISMPVAWSKVDTHPDAFNIFSPLPRDPWKNFFD